MENPMELKDLAGLLSQQKTGVVTTFRRDGRPQMSLVSFGLFDDGIAFTVPSSRAKAKNLARDPRCGILIARQDYRGYAAIEGKVEVRSSQNTDAETLTRDLRSVYTSAAGREHPDWEEYDQVMKRDDRIVMILRPGSMVGLNLP
jgi:PPOX class probable F420-dependent enzyme